MATGGKIHAGDKRHSQQWRRQPARWRRNLLLLALLIGGVVLAYAWQGMREKALVGSAYAARVGCACRYVSQRPLKSCIGDLQITGPEGVAGMASLSEDATDRTVTASVPLLASQTASFDPHYGCALEPWKD